MKLPQKMSGLAQNQALFPQTNTKDPPKVQKEPFTYVLQNRCSYKFPNIHKKISVLDSLFNKVTSGGCFLKWLKNFKEFLIQLERFVHKNL